MYVPAFFACGNFFEKTHFMFKLSVATAMLVLRI